VDSATVPKRTRRADLDEPTNLPFTDKYRPVIEVDQVNSPPHYTTGGIETIDFIEAKGLNYNRGNAVKYISRAGIKSAVTEIVDLEKAIWYLNREIERLKNG
jgi:hypothetical protein